MADLQETDGYDLELLDMKDPETRNWVGQNIDFSDAGTREWYDSSVKPVKSDEKKYGEDFVFKGDRTPFEGLGNDFESQYASLMQRAVTDPSVSEKDFNELGKQFAPESPGFGGTMDKFLSEVRSGKVAPNYTPVYGEGWDDYLAQKERSAGDKMFDATRQGVLEGFGDTVIRAFDDWTNIQRSALEASNPGQSEEWYTETTDRLRNEAERTLRDEIHQRQEQDSMFDPAAFIGGMLGSVGPEMLLPMGSGALGRVLMSGATNAAADAVYQNRDISNEQQDEFSLERLGMNTLMGAGLQGALEVPGAVFRGIERGATPKAPNEVTPSSVERVTPISMTKKGKETVKSRKLGESIQEVATAADDVRSGWKNSPETTVRENFNDLDDAVDALGVFDAETGTVLLNAEGIRKEAAHRGLSVPEMTKTVLFHESLGHYGLAQKFRETLDEILDTMYRQSTYLQNQTDDWLARNPDVYLDDPAGQHIRAAEEVFAEASENKVLPATLYNVMKNKVKDFLRRIPAFENLEFSKRELETILAQAHSAVVNGKGADVRGNGFRTKLPTRREQSKEATARLAETKAGETQTTQPFPKEESDYHRFRHVTEDGKAVTGTYTVTDGKLDNFSISSEGGAKSIGPKAIRQIGRDLLAAHPEAKSLSGFRISGARPTEKFATSGTRFMKSTFGESKGTQQGIRETGMSNKARSNRVIENELEFGPRKGQTFEEWVSRAEDTKMSQKIAEKLSRGAEVPEVLAARKLIVQLSNTVADLKHKVADGTATPQESYLFARAVEKNERVKDVVADIISNASHLMNSQKIEVASDTKIKDTVLRRMLASKDRELLNTVEGREEFAKKLVKGERNAKLLELPLQVLQEIINFGRSLIASIDVSGPFRQGYFLMGDKNFWKNYPGMYKALASQKYYDMSMSEIVSRDTYSLMKRGGLPLTEVTGDLSKREEKFQSRIADYIPGVKASERAYSGFLNKLAADTFDDMVRAARRNDVDVAKDIDLLKSMAALTNAAVGRGNLGSLEAAAGPLATGLFSPRLIASRLKLLNPATYVTQPKEVRQKAIQSLLTTATLTATILSLAKMAGAEVETDPRSSDFLKIKIGDTRYDVLGGFGQYLTLGARLYTNETKSGRGTVKVLGEGYKSDTRWDVLNKFFSNKAAPAISFAIDYLRGSNAVGEEFNLKETDPFKNPIINRFIPLVIQDLKESVDNNGVIKGLGMGAPAFLGVGTQSYDTFDRLEEKLGQDPNKKPSPVTAEIIRLSIEQDRDIIQGAPTSFRDDGVKYDLSEEQKGEWTTYMGDLIQQYVSDDMKTEEYKEASDEDKRQMVKQARSDAYLDTKVYFLDKYWPENEGDDEE